MICPICESANCQKISVALKTDVVETEENTANYGITIGNQLGFSVGNAYSEGKSRSLFVKELPQAPMVFTPGTAFILCTIAFSISEIIISVILGKLFDLEIEYRLLFDITPWLIFMNSVFAAIICYYLREEIRHIADESYAEYRRWECRCVCKACGHQWESNF